MSEQSQSGLVQTLISHRVNDSGDIAPVDTRWRLGIGACNGKHEHGSQQSRVHLFELVQLSGN